jgi:steroid delta-isomerase
MPTPAAPTPEEMTAAVHAYVAAFEQGDPAAARDLFAADGTVEDPVGSPPHRGHDAIEAFYAQTMATGAKLHLDGPIRVAGNAAAFAFSARLTIDGAPHRIDVIDVFEFDGAGKVASMRAYFGPANFSNGAAPHA